MDTQFIGPFTMSIGVRVRGTQDARKIGNVEVTLSPGAIPTLEDIHNAIGQALDGIPDDFRLMDPDEFFNDVLIPERFGKQKTKFATPDEWEYDADELTKKAVAECARRKAEKASKKRRQSHEEE